MSDYDLPSVFSEKIRTARREHKCCECQRTIKTGERYHFAKGCWEGKWGEYKTCASCHELRRDLIDDDNVLAPFGYLREWAQDMDVKFPVEPE
jgi:hypothetical protein